MLLGRWRSQASPYLPLPSSAEELDASLSAKFRGNLRRRARLLEAEVGPLRLEQISQRREVDAAFDDGLRLEAAGWKGVAGTAISCDAWLTARYRALAHAFAAKGSLALYFLSVGQQRVAFHFGLIEGGVYYLLKPGLDPELSRYGVGHLLLRAVAQDLIERKVTELDFLGDDLPWKRDWTARTRTHSWHYLFPPTHRGRLLHAAKFRLAPLVKRTIALFARG
jgi:CelD/BcsL family acetyltransferase involved in cellulose biosynthesis